MHQVKHFVVICLYKFAIKKTLKKSELSVKNACFWLKFIYNEFNVTCNATTRTRITAARAHILEHWTKDTHCHVRHSLPA